MPVTSGPPTFNARLARIEAELAKITNPRPLAAELHLRDLIDTDLHSLAHTVTDGDVLAYDHASGKWVPSSSTGGGTPAISVVAETTFGQSPAVGTDTTVFARGNHTHGTPGNPVTAHEAAGNPHSVYVLRAGDTMTGALAVTPPTLPGGIVVLANAPAGTAWPSALFRGAVGASVVWQVEPNGTTKLIGEGVIAHYKDTAGTTFAPTYGAATGLNVPGLAVGNHWVVSTYKDAVVGGSGVWTERFRVANDGVVSAPGLATFGSATLGSATPSGSVEPIEARGTFAGVSLDDRAGGTAERWVVFSNRAAGATTETLHIYQGRTATSRLTIGPTGVVGLPGGVVTAAVSATAVSASSLTVAGSGAILLEDSVFTVDDATNARVGFVKKSGAFTKLAVGSGAPFAIARASTGNVTPAATYTDLLTITGTVVDVPGSLTVAGVPVLTTAGAGVTSFNTRAGAVTLTTGDVTGALAYTPLNRAGDTISGAVVVGAGGSIVTSTSHPRLEILPGVSPVGGMLQLTDAAGASMLRLYNGATVGIPQISVGPVGGAEMGLASSHSPPLLFFSFNDPDIASDAGITTQQLGSGSSRAERLKITSSFFTGGSAAFIHLTNEWNDLTPSNMLLWASGVDVVTQLLDVTGDLAVSGNVFSNADYSDFGVVNYKTRIGESWGDRGVTAYAGDLSLASNSGVVRLRTGSTVRVEVDSAGVYAIDPIHAGWGTSYNTQVGDVGGGGGVASVGVLSLDAAASSQVRLSVGGDNHVVVRGTATSGATLETLVTNPNYAIGTHYLRFCHTGAGGNAHIDTVTGALYLNWYSGGSGGNHVIIGNGAAGYGNLLCEDISCNDVFYSGSLVPSARRFKQDIADSPHGLATVLKMRPRTFAYKSSPDRPRHGFVWEEMVKVFPDACRGVGEDDRKAKTERQSRRGIDFTPLMPAVVRAIQELEARLAALEAA